jgi:hypothetical protein
VRLFEDEVGLGTDALRLAKISMTATTSRGKVGVKILAPVRLDGCSVVQSFMVYLFLGYSWLSRRAQLSPMVVILLTNL